MVVPPVIIISPLPPPAVSPILIVMTSLSIIMSSSFPCSLGCFHLLCPLTPHFVRFGHVTCSSHVCLHNFGSLTTIQLTVILCTSAVVIRCLCSPLGVLGVPLPSFLNSNTFTVLSICLWCHQFVVFVHLVRMHCPLFILVVYVFLSLHRPYCHHGHHCHCHHCHCCCCCHRHHCQQCCCYLLNPCCSC